MKSLSIFFQSQKKAKSNLPCKFSPANITNEWLFACMCSDVGCKVITTTKSPHADATLKRFLTWLKKTIIVNWDFMKGLHSLVVIKTEYQLKGLGFDRWPIGQTFMSNPYHVFIATNVYWSISKIIVNLCSLGSSCDDAWSLCDLKSTCRFKIGKVFDLIKNNRKIEILLSGPAPLKSCKLAV